MDLHRHLCVCTCVKEKERARTLSGKANSPSYMGKGLEPSPEA